MKPIPLLLLSLLGTTLHSSYALKNLTSLSSVKIIAEFNNDVAALLYNAYKTAQNGEINTLELFLNDTKTVTVQVINDYPVDLTESLKNALEPFIQKIGNSWNFNETTASLVDSFKQCDEFFAEFAALTNSEDVQKAEENEDEVPASPVDEQTIKNFVNTIGVEEDNSLSTTINNIQDLMTPGSMNTVYTTLKDYLDKFNQVFKDHERCDFTMTIQDHIKEVYDLVVLNRVRASAMNLFAINFHQLDTTVHKTQDITNKIYEFISETSRILKASKELYKKASFNLTRCDPDEHILDENCFRLEDLFTKYYANERQLSDTCDLKYKYLTTYNYVECLDETKKKDDLHLPYYCPSRQCYGKLHGCRKVSDMPAFCESPYKTGPRYLWSVDKVNDSFVDSCPGQFVDTMRKTSCKNLMCQCSEEGAESSATRAVNINPQMADIYKNKVVTNMRFLKQDNMIHLQIEQATLLPEGMIDMDSKEIVPVGKYRYLKNSAAGSFVMIDPNNEEDEIYLQHDVNYTFIREDHARFHLDEFELDKSYVLTGVRLRNSELNPETGMNINPIELQIHVTAFSYQKGLLIPDYEEGPKWITPKNLENREGYGAGREYLDLSNLRDSMTESFINVRDSLPNQEIMFQPSSVDGNLGQTTIPYFDSRPPVENSFRALGGVGIIHRGTAGHGGFLAPELKTINHATYTLAGISDNNLKEIANNWNS